MTSNNGILETHDCIFQIPFWQMEDKANEFFSWVMNLGIIKSYNTHELVLIQSIWILFFPELENPLNSKKALNRLQDKICSNGNMDRKNNRHLLKFMVDNSLKFKEYVNRPMRIDGIDTWADFFKAISVLRNIIAHDGGVISKGVLNDIKSKAKKIFLGTLRQKERPSGERTFKTK